VQKERRKCEHLTHLVFISRVVGSGIDKDPANLVTRLSPTPTPTPKPRRILNFVGVLFWPVFYSSDRRRYFERDGCAFVNNFTGRPIIIDRGTPRSSSRVGPATRYRTPLAEDKRQE